MGWWNQNQQGVSFADATSVEGADAESGVQMVWGDPVADRMADAVADIVVEFRHKWRREPTKAEVRAGLEFCLRGYGDGLNVATEPDGGVTC